MISREEADTKRVPEEVSGVVGAVWTGVSRWACTMLLDEAALIEDDEDDEESTGIGEGDEEFTGMGAEVDDLVDPFTTTPL